MTPQPGRPIRPRTRLTLFTWQAAAVAWFDWYTPWSTRGHQRRRRADQFGRGPRGRSSGTPVICCDPLRRVVARPSSARWSKPDGVLVDERAVDVPVLDQQVEQAVEQGDVGARAAGRGGRRPPPRSACGGDRRRPASAASGRPGGRGRAPTGRSASRPCCCRRGTGSRSRPRRCSEHGWPSRAERLAEGLRRRWRCRAGCCRRGGWCRPRPGRSSERV